MAYEYITYEVDERVGVITFNNPSRHNSFSYSMKNEFRTAISEVESDDNVRVVVVRGAGGKAFSTGYDLNDSVGIPRRGISEWRSRLADDYDFTCSVWMCSKPVIAEIEGYCLAGALEFAQMCDVRYCSENAQFGVVETRFSAGVATLVMPWVVGQRCREYIFTGDTFGAEEAKELGIVSRIFESSELHAETMRIAKRMSQVALACLQWNKRAINQTYETMGFRAAMQYGVEACAILDSTDTPEFQEFDAIRRDKGVKEALKWRDEQFKAYE